MQFKSIWLYTLLTVVSTVVCCQSFAEALSDAAIRSNQETCLGEHPSRGQPYLDCLVRLNSSASGGTAGAGAVNDCTRLQTELAREEAEFSAACRDVNLSGNVCQERYATCIDGDYSDDEEDADDGGSSLAPNSSSSSRSRGTIPRERFAACPSTALDVAKESKEELKELRDDLKDLKEKRTQKNLDIVAVENEITDKNVQYEEDVAERGKTYKTAVEEKTKNNEGETEDLTNQITTTSQELTKLVAQQDTLLIEYIEQVAQIEGVCEAEAERELSKRREDQVKALQNSGQRQRNISELLRLRVSGRSSADEAFRRRAILRCQQNPARYQRPVTLLNNRFEEKKAALKTAITQTQAALVELQRKLSEKNPKFAAELQAMSTEYNSDLNRMKTARDAAVGTCQGAPQTMGANQMQTGAQNCSGLMKKLNLEQQALQTLEGDIREKEADIAFTQELFSAARSATGGNTSGARATQDISGAGADVVHILGQLVNMDACSVTQNNSVVPATTTPSSSGRDWNEKLRRMSPSAARTDSIFGATGSPGGNRTSPATGSPSSPTPVAPAGAGAN